MTHLDLKELHERLLDRDPTASLDLFEAFYHDLTSWLRVEIPYLAPGIDSDLYFSAAFSALDAYIKAPEKYDPARRGLWGYLKMSAKGDLLNMLERERSRRNREVVLEDVAERLAGRNIESEGMDADALQSAVAQLKTDLREDECRVLDLLIEGERRTDVFARVLDIAHLPQEEQRLRVKQVKDRLKKRLKRRGQFFDEL